MAEARKTPMPGERPSVSDLYGKPSSAVVADNRKREPAVGPGAGNRAKDRTDTGCPYTVDEQSRRKLE